MNYNEAFQIVQNKSYHIDVEFAFKYNRWLLYLSACWPFNEKKSLLLELLNKIGNFLTVFAMIGFVMPLLFLAITSNEDKTQQIKDVAFALIGPGYIMKYLIFIYNKSNLKACIEQLQSDWCNIFHGSRNVLLKYAKVNKNFVTIMMIMYFLNVVNWQIYTLMKNSRFVNNLTVHNLPMGEDYGFFNGGHDPYYPYAHAVQCIGQFLIMVSTCNTAIIVTFMLHLCGQFRVISNIIIKFGDTNWPGKVYLKQVIKKQYSSMR